jgi:glycerol-3-phosphate acyltransferase PlsX
VIRVALDAMGGDRAPGVEVEGTARALETLPEHVTIQLVGRPEAIEAELAKHPEIDRSRVEIHTATEVIGMA